MCNNELYGEWRLCVELCEGLLQISQNVVYVLRTDGKADGAGRDATLPLLIRRHLGVSGGSRVYHEALQIRYISHEREEAQGIDEMEGFFLPTFQFKGKDGAASIRVIAQVCLMVRVESK